MQQNVSHESIKQTIMITSVDEFNDLIKAIDGLKSTAVSSIQAVNDAKADIVNKIAEVAQTFQRGKYIENPDRIIISSPDIVIGNVDRWGVAKGGGTVTLRASNINIEGAPSGAGTGGMVKIQAPSIHQYASNPGFAGTGESVEYGSEILLHAGGIGLQADNIDNKNVLSNHSALTRGFVSLVSDSGISMTKNSHEGRSETPPTDYTTMATTLATDSLTLQGNLAKIAATLEANLNSLYGSLPPAMQLAAAITNGKADNVEIFTSQSEFNEAVVELCNNLENYLKKMFEYKSLQIKFDNDKGQDKYNVEENQTQNHAVNISTNDVTITTGVDKKDSSVSILSEQTFIGSYNENSYMELDANDVIIATAKSGKVKEKDGYIMQDKGTLQLISKSLSLDSLASGESKEQTADSKLEIKFKDILIDTAPVAKDDPDKGKGKIAVNTKQFDLTGYECMAEATKKFDTGSKVNIAAVKIKLGGDKSSKELTTAEVLMTTESGDILLDKKGTILSAYNDASPDTQITIPKSSDIYAAADSVTLGKNGEVEITDSKVKFEADVDGGSNTIKAKEIIANKHLKGPKTDDK